MQRRYPVALLLAATWIVLGIALQQPGWLSLAVLLLVYALGLLLSDLSLPNASLSAARSPHRTRLVEGELVEVELTITNRGRSVDCAIVDELPQEALLLSGHPASLCHIDSGGTGSVRYAYRSPRGIHEQQEARVFIWARFGLAVEQIRFDCPTWVSASPRIEPLPLMLLRPRKLHAFVGPIHARTAGPGVEFFGCRAYAEGDDVRRINWRAVARYDRVFVNEYEQERATDVVLVLDVRAASHHHVGDVSTFEPCCRAAASLAAHHIRQGNRVGLLLYGRSLDWIAPAGGRFHLDRVLSILARAQPVSSAAFDDLASLPLRMLPSGCQVVLISALARDGDEAVLPKLRARGYTVLALLADSLDLERSAQVDDDSLDLAYRMLALRTVALCRLLRSQGVHVVRWDVRRPLAEALHTARMDQAAARVR